MTDLLRRVLWALRHPIWVYGPRCGSHGPWRLADCGPCIAPRGHEHHGGPSPDWHADGTGYIWNDREGRWRWMGPPVSVEDLYDLPPEVERTLAVFTETTTERLRAEGIIGPDDALAYNTEPIRLRPERPQP